MENTMITPTKTQLARIRQDRRPKIAPWDDDMQKMVSYILSSLIVSKNAFKFKIWPEAFGKYEEVIKFIVANPMDDMGAIKVLGMKEFLYIQEQRNISHTIDNLQRMIDTVHENHCWELLRQTTNPTEATKVIEKLNTIGITGVSIGDVYEKMFDMFDKKSKGKLGSNSPFEQLDLLTHWIIQGKTYTIGGYSNTGKSKLAYFYLASLLKQGKSVNFYSLEVDSETVLTNLICAYYNLNFSEVLCGQHNELIMKKNADFDKLKIYDTLYDITEIVNATRVDSPDAIFVDFVQNVRNRSDPRQSEYERLTEIATTLQQLGISTHTTVFSISQVWNASRTAGGETMLKGSGALFASSDVIFVIARDQKTRESTLHLIKNKFGPVGGEWILNADFAKGQFRLWMSTITDLPPKPKYKISNRNPDM